jgi:hypothetical protein
MNPVARKVDILVQQLSSDETIVYDKAKHQAHCLNATVFNVWQNADGKKSVEELTAHLSANFAIPYSEDLVVLALQELEQADLLESQHTFPPQRILPSRRDMARNITVAGISAALLPIVTSLAAPTPAMARSGLYTAATYEREFSIATADLQHGKADAKDLKEAIKEYTAAVKDGDKGLEAESKNRQAEAQNDFQKGEGEFDEMLKALGLPPL